MSNRPRTNLRLVKCPKCAKILPEPKQVPVYACGGCNTVLQAKYYKKDNDARGLSLHREDAVQNNGIAHAPVGGESDGLRQKSSSVDQESSDQHEERNDSLPREDVVQTNGMAHALDGRESDGSCQKSSSADQGSSDETEEKKQSALIHYDSRKIESTNSAHDTVFLGVSGFVDNKENGKTNGKIDQIEPRDCVVDQNQEQLGVVNATKEASLPEPSIVEHCNQKKVGDFNSAGGSSIHNESQIVENTKSYQLGCVNGAKEDEEDQLEVSRDVSFDKHKQSTSREASMSSYECLGIQIKEPQKLAPENGAVRLNGIEKEQNVFTECFTEKLEGIKLGGDNDSTVSLDICEGESVSPPSSPELMITTERVETVDNSLKVSPTSPPTRASFASKESTSSSDGDGDQVLRKQEHLSENLSEETLPENNAVSGYVGSEESPEWSNEPSPRNAYGCLAKRMLEEEESVEENLLHFGRPNRHGFPPRVPPLYGSSDMSYETGSSSSYVHDELHMRHHHPYKYEKSETCFRKTHIHRGNVDRRRRLSEAVWRENDQFLPMYYNYETSGEIYQRLRYSHGHNDRKRRSESWSQNGILPPMPSYLGEMFNGRHQIPNPYMHRPRHPDDLRWSAQLPPAAVCCHQGLCIAPSTEISWDPYDSYPTSPRQFIEPDPYPWVSQDSIFSSEDQRYKDQIMRRLYLREKRQAMKRHLLPVAGGAPFITCYFCFRVLQLPENSLRPRRRRRRTHKLKCGACSNILEFSLEKECNLISEEAKALDVEGGEMRGEASLGMSGRDDRKCASSNEEGTDIAVAGGSSAQGRQMKVTWQLPPRTTKSPLHRLMGYSSLHDLLNDRLEEVEK